MSFDEHLKQAFETLNDRLRDDIARQVRAVVDELAATARTERERAADEAARAAADAARTAVEDAARSATDAARATADAALAEARTAMRAADLTARERLLAAVRAMDRARSLTEIFDALSLGIEREAARTAVLLVSDGGAQGSADRALRGWRFSGFNSSLDRSHTVEVPPGNRGVIDQAIRTAGAVSDNEGSTAPPPFDLAAGRRRLAVPISIAGTVVAVVYADEGAADEERVAPGWDAAVEILTRHAARSLESVTAFKTARALSDRPALASIGTIGTAAETSGQSDADQAARRYARLLVSEIKLYHEGDVAAGRRERNLATRLSAEIDRARALYQERVPADVRLRTDFFEAELVRTLADGDASLLEAKS